jgi:hypothetical protein
MKTAMKNNKLLGVILAYGVIVGFLSAWWWHITDSLFLPNIPAVLLGDKSTFLQRNYYGETEIIHWDRTLKHSSYI